MALILQLVCWVLTIYLVVLIVRIVFSWVPSPPEPLLPLARLTRALTDPLLNPVRGLFPALRTGAVALDFSPMIVIFAIFLLQGVLC